MRGIHLEYFPVDNARYIPENISMYTVRVHFLRILTFFFIDNVHIIYRKIQYIKFSRCRKTILSNLYILSNST
jgi:hypothetical protein